MTRGEFIREFKNKSGLDLKKIKDIMEWFEQELTLVRYNSTTGDVIYGKVGPLFTESDETLLKIKELVLSEEDKLLMEDGRKFTELAKLLKDKL